MQGAGFTLDESRVHHRATLREQNLKPTDNLELAYHVRFGLWEKTGVHGKIPRMHERIQKDPSWDWMEELSH